MRSLWGEAFELPTTQEKARKIVRKVERQTESQKLKSKKTSIEDKLSIIKSNVTAVLGSYANNTVVIRDKKSFTSYIDKAIQNGVIAVDTETNNSLDPLTCKIMGLCIYTPGEKNAYVPVNHVNPETGTKLENQLTEQDIKEELSRLVKTPTRFILHNADFDFQVIYYTCDVSINVDWDTMIGSKILDENEPAGLKYQYAHKIDDSIEKYSINSFFESIEYAVVDPDIFALYAATDAYMTYRLYLYQKDLFSRPENAKLYHLFKDIEIPISKVVTKMEMTGVSIDTDYACRLSKYYRSELAELDEKIAAELENLRPQILEWRLTPEANFKPKKAKVTKSGEEYDKSKSEQLKDPVEVTSATQLAILIYDVLGYPPQDKKTPRGTGEDILEKLANQGFTLGKIILEKRGLIKLLNTFIEAIPAQLSPRDNRLHAHFSTTGTNTGRLSSSNPNLQNIPSGNKAVRLIFRASPGCSIVGGDFSQQEPRLLAHYTQDEQMIEAYKNKKDLYATMASQIYGNSYWDNMEHHEDGTPNPEGKKRRSSVKGIVLGLLYGRGAISVAEQINVSIQEAQELIDKFFNGFPKVREWIDNVHKFAHENGYVEGLLGRRRRLPDILLPRFSIECEDEDPRFFNPLLGTSEVSKKRNRSITQKYQSLLEKAKTKRDRDVIREEALRENIKIEDNSGFIAQAERQSQNTLVQGGAATITKIAMVDVDRDEILNNLGFKMLICVHDEIIGECPRENAHAVSKRLSQVMIESAAKVCSVPMKCDCYEVSRWYEDDFSDFVHSEYTKLIEVDSLSEIEAQNLILNTYPMIEKTYLFDMMKGTYLCNTHETI